MTKMLLGLSCLLVAMGGLTCPARAELPYARHGWSREQAAAHLLSRFSFGPEPGQVQAVANGGLEAWLEGQLTSTFPDQELKARLSALPPAYGMTVRQVVATYPLPNQVKARARKDGTPVENGRELREAMEQQGARPLKELGTTLLAQKLYHTRYSQAQLREVMSEFWFNHFNVALSNNKARRFVLAYERDALRPNALGSFRSLLGATAKHPAMLWYLDNATSTASTEATTSSQAMKGRRKGLNENYARELLELHTLGVDGGYSQKDVSETARVLTGWTVMPYEREKQMQQLAQRGQAIGLAPSGDFLFAAPLHDAGAKTVLGTAFPAGQGQDEGERLLDLVASHQATARHLARKMAVRFVSDQPDEALVGRLSTVFLDSGGDTRAMLRAIANSDEFWQESTRGAKVKSPLELVVSAARILDADLEPTPQLYDWLAGMGQPLFNYKAPTGFPDRAEAWVNSGTVLQRMNFALEAARGQVPGFSYQVPALDSLRSAVLLALPARDPAPVLEKLQPLAGQGQEVELEKPARPEMKGNLGGKLPGINVNPMTVPPARRETATMLGLVLGSPEFQRR